MPAKHHIDNASKLIITTWEGEAVDAEFIEAMKKYQKDIQSNPDYSDYNELLDFSKVTDIKVTAQGIKNIGKIATRTDQKDIRRKLAIVAPTNMTFFFARMYQAFRSLPRNSNKELHVFMNENDALEWLKK